MSKNEQLSLIGGSQKTEQLPVVTKLEIYGDLSKPPIVLTDASLSDVEWTVNAMDGTDKKILLNPNAVAVIREIDW